MAPPAVTFVTPDLESNSTGRTYCLWLLARAAGMETRVLATVGDEVWSAIDDAEFIADVTRLAPSDLAVASRLSAGSVIVAVKPFETSLGVASAVSSMMSAHLVADIDDPDLEAVLGWRDPVRRLARQGLRRNRVRNAAHMRRLLTGLPKIVSNPTLQAHYGGVVIPHVRADRGTGLDHVSTAPNVAFVGTVRSHKGIETLRQAVARTQDVGTTLTVTADPPPDAKPWERWVGTGSFSEGLEIVRTSDIVAIPSRRTAFSQGQFPAKVVDAMLAGRAVIASDLPPIRWALGSAGVLVRPGSVKELAAGVRALADPVRRQADGQSLRAAALASFTVDANAEPFRRALSV